MKTTIYFKFVNFCFLIIINISYNIYNTYIYYYNFLYIMNNNLIKNTFKENI